MLTILILSFDSFDSQLWVDMQTKYDLCVAEEKLHDILKGMHRIESPAIA